MLQANVPIAGALGATAGGGFGTGWMTEGVSGIFRSGCQPDQSFTPLYSLMQIGKRKHRSRVRNPPDPATLGQDWYVCQLQLLPSTDESLYSWVDAPLPWNSLDEDGVEMEEVEQVSCPVSDVENKR